jgi:3-dehydroquinate dehydratase-2
MRQVLVLNGPNLGRLGAREPEVYGSASFDDLAGECRAAAAKLGLRADVRQTDDETELIRWVHEAADGRIPVVLNPAAFTHYSYALRDALAIRTAPLVEVHLSNPAARESFRHNSVVAGVADGTIAGFGLMSYRLALEAIAELAGPGEPGEPAEPGAAGEAGEPGAARATGEPGEAGFR